MEKIRCDWSTKDPLFIAYHDNEWGVPLHDERQLFEFLILETFQAGLSWITVLRKRDNFRKAFDNFEFKKIALYDEDKVQELLQNAGIIRNKLKVRAAISNANAFMEIQKEFGSFDKYIWGFVNGKPIQTNRKLMSEITATTETSDKLSKDLKKRGFKFVGSTVIYAHMQATGMVNDHIESCFRFDALKGED
ncbi:MAG: DNA-3-methyladenine glycosylase I [Flavobacteriales bacterium]|jgi:DNA-3-methyladenine glycosylase I|tara:strand:- start:9950 stop:10525 length:576 start_codon:yes stop_codon:yes gene_type:complete